MSRPVLRVCIAAAAGRPGQALAVPEAAVPGLLATVIAVMARAATHRQALGAAESRCSAADVWSHPRTDPGDRYVYLDSPVARWSGGLGCQPTRTLTIALIDLPGLRRRLATTESMRRRTAPSDRR